MRNILLVAKREYLEQIHGRAFLVSTILLPLFIAAVLGWASYTNRDANSGRHLAIVADNAPLANAIRRQMMDDKNAKDTVDVAAPASEADRADFLKKVQNKSIDGLLDLKTSSTGAITATYTSLSSGGFVNLGRMKDALNRSIANQRLIARGVNQADVDTALKSVSIETLQLDKSGKADKSKGASPLNKAMLIAFLLSMPIMLYGLDMARAIIEEKTSRIFEVMLAVARADDLLAGKLLGVGGVAFTQITIWMVASILFMSSALAAAVLTGDFSIHFSVMETISFPIYFALGFALFSAMFSGLAATCETSQDLQKFMPMAIIPTYIGFGSIVPLIKDPNSTWSIVASLFPFTSPYVMLPRMGLTAVPLWQVAASLLLLVATIWAMIWFSSRLYRVGILMYGKRATLPELLRWLRYS